MQAAVYVGDGRIAVEEVPCPEPGPGEVLVRTLVNAISSGTEMLFYRGELEEGIEVDTALDGYRRRLEYPLPYGYASVGRITHTGPDVDTRREGELVFAFVPHASAFRVDAHRAVPVPQGIEAEDAAFLAAAETAVNLVLDASPLLGERVSLFGLGVVGLLTAGLLAGFPLSSLTAWDLLPRRRQAAAMLGVIAADPSTSPPPVGSEDLAIDVSGSPAGFRFALASCRFSGRLVVGSLYGTRARRATLEAFDTAFHRNRVRIISSQVSTIDPALSARWTHQRRLEAAWSALRTLRPSRLITHRTPFALAAEAYRLIAGAPGETIQVMLVHEDAPPPR